MNDKLVLSVQELASVLGICKPRAYELMNSADFPAIQISPRRKVVPRDAQETWLTQKAAHGRSNQKNRPACCSTPDGKSGEKARKPSPLPFYQIEGSFTRMPITEILKHGRVNAIRAEILAAKLETTPRGLRRQIMLGGFFDCLHSSLLP